MDLNEDTKRLVLPPLIGLPIVVGFLLILVGGIQGGGMVMVYIGAAILIGNGVFWPLLYTRQGKKEKEERRRQARQRTEEE